jgi:hypothetical protein
MNEDVLQALQKAESDLQALQQDERDALALYFDLYDRDYAPDGKFSEDYPYYSKNDSPPRYFRKAPKALTDEEFEALKAAKAKLDAAKTDKDKAEATAQAEEPVTVVGSIYTAIGVLLLIATAFLMIFAGTTLSSGYYNDGYVAAVLIGILLAGVLLSLGWFAVGKALALLQEVSNHTDRIP